MVEDKKRDPKDGSSNIEEILRERERLNQILQEKFKREVTILFTDICGYTQYTDTRGDISGRAMLQKHNDIVLPLIGAHEGIVIKTIGDAVMATFSSPLAAVKASIAIQNGLSEHNQKAEAADSIHVKIGINTGEALMDEADVFGDAVNVASRIQSQAGEDQILLSRSVYEQVRGSEDILCRLHGTAQVKGKTEPIELYRVIWQDEEIILSAEPRVRGYKAVAEKRVEHPLRELQLEVTRENKRLKISVYEQSAGEVSTIRHYDEIPAPIDTIGDRCRDLVEILNKVNRRGRMTREVMVKLREIGQALSDELFTSDVKEKVRETRAEHLILNLDDQLVHVPWELVHDGQQFLCQRFSMGRLVKTRQPIVGSRTRMLARPLKMLILVDPQGDLKEAYNEGAQIYDYIDRHRDFISVSLRSENITPEFIKGRIRNFDLIHFAGHADYNQQNPRESGWQLTKGHLKAQEIIEMGKTSTMPALIFANACQSARTEEWTLHENFQYEIFGLANAFLLSGVKHYVGTFWEILDEPSSRFALEFYTHVLSGTTIGEAVRLARMELIKEYGEESIVWASYLLYGDPTFNYMDQIKVRKEREEGELYAPPQPEAEVRAEGKVVEFPKKEVKAKKWAWLGVAAGVLLIAGILLFGYPGLLREGTEKYERAALTCYNEGNFEEALNACEILKDKNPKVRMAYLIQGNILLRRGSLDKAESIYQRGLQASKGTNIQKAEALIGLGRIASIEQQPNEALHYYQQATELAPASSKGYLSQALVLESKGRYDKALNLLGKAQEKAPQDQLIASIKNETREKVALANDKEKQEHIDQLVKELLETMKSPPRALPTDGWTSQPLSMWMMDFQARGYSLQEGEERLLVSGLTDNLLQSGRIQVVERALLDRLLEELKLGASDLADRRTALSLGKILAARLILPGQLIYSGPQTQVSMRVIETETGRIRAAVNESFGSSVPASILAEKLSTQLIGKLEELYPLRGKIAEVRDEEIKLNIGQNVGVREGEQFKVVDEDLVLSIISVQQDVSLAKIAKGEGIPQEDMRVEAIKTQGK